GPARHRRPRPPPAREARRTPGRAQAAADRSGRRVPYPAGVRLLRVSRRLPPIGLRTRLVAALVATSAATLAIAALALLSPLEHRLRNEELRFLTSSARASETSLRELSEGQLTPHSRALIRVANNLERRTGARVLVFN